MFWFIIFMIVCPVSSLARFARNCSGVSLSWSKSLVVGFAIICAVIFRASVPCFPVPSLNTIPPITTAFSVSIVFWLFSRIGV